MKTRLEKLLEEALKKQAEIEHEYKKTKAFSLQLVAQSLKSHVDDLRQQLSALEDKATIELIELRLQSQRFSSGSIPLGLLANIAEELRLMLGYAALRLFQGGIRKKRVPAELYGDLDMRLAGVLPGSTRLLITAASGRDLFGDGITKNALDRVFAVLVSNGQGQDFLQAVTDLGPLSAKHLRGLLHLIRLNGASVDISWRYGGETVNAWIGSAESIQNVEDALDLTNLTASEEIVLEGVIELLSKRERIQLVCGERSIRVLFPKRLLNIVSALHLDQTVKLKCSVTETSNPLTGESSTFYELIEVL